MKKLPFLLIVGSLFLLLVGGAVWAPPLARAGAQAGGSGQPFPQEQDGQSWFGAALVPLKPALAERLGLDPQTTGLVVLKVMPGGPAALAGLERGDVITEINGIPVSTVAQVRELLAQAQAGDSWELTVLQGGTETTVLVELGLRPFQEQPGHHGGFRGAHPGGRGFGGMERVLPFGLGLFHHFIQAEITMADENGNPVSVELVAGELVAVEGGELTLDPNGAGESITVSVPEDAYVGGPGGHRPLELSDLAAGTRLVLVSVEGVLEAVLVLPGWGGETPPWPNPMQESALQVLGVTS